MGVVDGGMNPVFNVMGETVNQAVNDTFRKTVPQHDLSQLFKLGFYFFLSADAVNAVDQCSHPHFDSIVTPGNKALEVSVLTSKRIFGVNANSVGGDVNIQTICSSVLKHGVSVSEANVLIKFVKVF